MWLEQRRQAMLQLHLSDQQIYCQLWCVLYKRYDGTSSEIFTRGAMYCVLLKLDTVDLPQILQDYSTGAETTLRLSTVPEGCG